MPDMRLWIKEPYPFRREEMEALKKALKRMYERDIRIVYGLQAHGESRAYYDTVDIDSVSMTTAKEIAAALKLWHLQRAIEESRPDSRVHAQDVTVEIRGQGDDPPDWYYSWMQEGKA